MSPFSNPKNLADVAKVIAADPLVRFVTTSNTFPNGFGYDDQGSSLINADAGDGTMIQLGGVSGVALKHIALGQVRQLRQLLPPHIDIIGMGGVRTARDVQDFLKAGATAVAITTALLEEGPTIFQRILADLWGIIVSYHVNPRTYKIGDLLKQPFQKGCFSLVSRISSRVSLVGFFQSLFNAF